MSDSPLLTEQEIDKIKSDAVMTFVNRIVEAREAGFIDDHIGSIAGVYQAAIDHVGMNYNASPKTLADVWGEDTAKLCRGGDDG